jgi:thioredoxin 2
MSFIVQIILKEKIGEGAMEESINACPHCGAQNRIGTPTPSQVPICGKCKSPLPWLVIGTDISFRKELETTTPVLVDFWAEWCAPCRAAAPVLEALARENAGQLKIVKINVDQNQATARQFNVMSIPTLILFINGKPIETIIGALSKDALTQKLKPLLA